MKRNYLFLSFVILITSLVISCGKAPEVEPVLPEKTIASERYNGTSDIIKQIDFEINTSTGLSCVNDMWVSDGANNLWISAGARIDKLNTSQEYLDFHISFPADSVFNPALGELAFRPVAHIVYPPYIENVTQQCLYMDEHTLVLRLSPLEVVVDLIKNQKFDMVIENLDGYYSLNICVAIRPIM